MILQDYLVTHALDNVWCSPDQDKQYLLRATRISNPNGDMITAQHMGVRIALPTPTERYHLWNVGQVNPSLLGMDDPQYAAMADWQLVTDTMRHQNLIFNLYTADGFEVPRHGLYYRFTATRSLVFAVPHLSIRQIGFNMRTEQLYVRVYSNAWYRLGERDLDIDRVTVETRKILTTNDILAMQGLVNNWRAKPGYVTCYVNGRMVTEISPFTARVGDIVEFVHDSSVKRVVDLPIAGLETFVSRLDQQQKYLFHYPEVSPPHLIDYHDDIDFYILLPTEHGRMVGHYYHRNDRAAVRMVTHRDYALSVHDVLAIGRALIGSQTTTLTLDDLKIRMVLRTTSTQRGIPFENQRIFELYRMPTQDVLRAMVGTQATVPVWRAENLEYSAYAKLMGTTRESVNRQMVEDAYGYNGLSKVLGDTPMIPYPRHGGLAVNVPMGLYQNATAYEYNADGVMLGHYYHAQGTVYQCQNATCRYVEMLTGRGSDRPLVRFGQDNIPLQSLASYRVYRSHLNSHGESDGIWDDITDTDLIRIDQGRVRWTGAMGSQYLMVRFDQDWLATDLELEPIAGTFYFTLSEFENRHGTDQHYVLPVPLGELDVFLNGRPLIRNLDYIVQFPKIYIVNQRYLAQPAGSTKQQIHVRFTGFCKSDLSMDDIEDYGFIEHGLLSNNLRYDLRDDKVLRITVDGRFRHRQDLTFSEFTSDVSIGNAMNGMPYQVKDIVVPMRGLTDRDTYALRTLSQAIDKTVSDYLTLKIPQPARDAVSAIPERYPIVSPFLCHILHDLTTEQIDVSQLRRVLTKMEVLEIVKPYEFLLDFDPLNEDLRYDRLRTRIVVHAATEAYELDLDRYRFYRQVVEYYGHGLVDISQYVTVRANPV